MPVSINELDITFAMMLIVCIVIIVILLIFVFSRRRARDRDELSRPLQTANQHLLITIKDGNKMARVRKRKVHWNASNGSGVVGYKLYWAVGKEINYDSDCAEVGNVTQVILPDDIPSFPLLAGDITLGVVAVNHIGNESDMATLSVPFDFFAPDAPTGLMIETI